MTVTSAPSERLLNYVQRATSTLTTIGRFPLVKLALVATWLYVLWWGERKSFGSHISSCDWSHWEKWPADATPHRLVLLADPQLVDPHTYPGRPWPLDKATISHTDQYLRRSYQTLQQSLDPDSIIFLGDLFDGGREWSTSVSDNPDPQWKGWGEDFWLKEYDRWGKIFLADNGNQARTGEHPRGDRKFIASLPGNHDLGISKGVRLDVRNRFAMFFGDPNRVDIIGNHSIVSVDTVSLTAKAIASAQEREDSKPVWAPPSEFLDGVQKQKAQALERYLAQKLNKPEHPRMEHSVHRITDSEVKETKSIIGSGLKQDVPTILLTHVPLFRAKGEPCGPLREKYPPTKGLGNVDGHITDERNAISLHGGYQYQNVLDPEISKELIEKTGNVAHVFSGDDHDYCEVVHRGYTSVGGGIREITVKSMSWAMGVRKPGFLLVSLWNPIDELGAPLTTHKTAGDPTIQTHLCLLPDALGTFIGYGQLFALTVVILLVLSFIGSTPAKDTAYAPILPLSELDSTGMRKSRRELDPSSCSASSNSSDSAPGGLAARGTQRSRLQTSENGWGDGSYLLANPSRESSRKGAATSAIFGTAGLKRRSRWWTTLHDFRASLCQVALAGILFYCWFAYTF